MNRTAYTDKIGACKTESAPPIRGNHISLTASQLAKSPQSVEGAIGALNIQSSALTELERIVREDLTPRLDPILFPEPATDESEPKNPKVISQVSGYIESNNLRLAELIRYVNRIIHRIDL